MHKKKSDQAKDSVKDNAVLENEEEVEKETEVNDPAEKEQKVTENSASDRSEEKVEKKEVRPEVDYKSKYLYLAAEMDNLYKRFARQKEDIVKFSNEKLVKELLPVLDNFDHSIEALKKEGEQYKNILLGIEMVYGSLMKVLNTFGMECVKTDILFDPSVHEALSYKPQEGAEDQSIIEVYQKGYILNGRVIRPAKVVIAKGE